MTTTLQPRAEFVRAISRLDATALVVGSMIGSGIFIVSAEILRQVQTPGVLLLVWGLSGVVTLLGALTYGELAVVRLSLRLDALRGDPDGDDRRGRRRLRPLHVGARPGPVARRVPRLHDQLPATARRHPGGTLGPADLRHSVDRLAHVDQRARRQDRR